MTIAVKGAFYLPGDEGYEQARVGRIFNARKPERYPAAILQVVDETDVVAGVRLAAERGWTISVRSGGHSWAAWSVHDDALLLDLGALRSLDYDDATGIVAAGPATMGSLELAPFLTERGRSFPGGHCASVGIGGYLLQGGQGWNGRLKGWACESVVAVDVVTADGDLIRADAQQNTDLYWAARGAGPGFPGVVVRFHLQTYPQPPVMWQDTWTFHLDDAERVVHWLHEVLPSLDRRVEPVLAATRLPDVPLYPGVEHPGGTVLLLHTTCMGQSETEVRALLQGLGECPVAGRELGRVTGPTTLAQESDAQIAQNPDGYRYAVDCAWSDASADVLAPLLLDIWRGLDTEHSFSIWYGWAPVRALPDMAFSVEGNVYVATYLIYQDAAEDERYRARVHEQTAAIARNGGVGVYLGDTDFTRRPDRFLTDENFQRLTEIRAVRDPHRRIASYLVSSPDRLNHHG
ncbi:FAD-binding protein [Jatrophihabitans telluris]|uniref:FAD-binding protein n=1 Tax=Jatrophihabitans telluris TaxID=2038343 RepID=A0ABY4QVS0_9ACTN|nr:FAD-binding protein [Jatrophihabitans telluris]UQX87418.1 FAD-binding protein [Jatrophihabitans telluris]